VQQVVRSALSSGLLENTSETERIELGLDRRAGSDHYRAFVGPPAKYDLLGALQFQAMTTLGLREHHSLLEVGCGSLRAGRLFLVYLLPGRYFGIEPNKRILKDGLRHHFGVTWWNRSVLRRRRPQFDFNDQFDFQIFGARFDFILAQSILSHTGPKETHAFLASCASVLKPGGKALVTYIRGQTDCSEDGWYYPKCVTYRDSTMAAIAGKYGLRTSPTEWPAMNNMPDGRISTQSPLILEISP
jgi:SAM-dependent methyltransferase